MQEAPPTARQPTGPEVGVAQTRTVLFRAGIVLAGYLVYAVLALTMPSPAAAGSGNPFDAIAREGLHVWLANGCQSCHSLYGLGGHSGPDLTNVTERRSPSYVEVIVRSGLPGMPRYEISDVEAAELAAFLVEVSATGVYPPKSLGGPVFGERR